MELLSQLTVVGDVSRDQFAGEQQGKVDARVCIMQTELQVITCDAVYGLSSAACSPVRNHIKQSGLPNHGD